jgi:trehalose 6-phosphate synthase/phosphatase
MNEPAFTDSATQKRRPGRLIIVSNRLPFSVSVEDNRLRFNESAGGLVSGLSGYVNRLQKSDDQWERCRWVGWPGGDVDEKFRAELDNEANRTFRSTPVYLSSEEMEQFYHGFCNKTIWPLFHYFPTIAEYKEEYWEHYKRVNAIFCDALARIVGEDDTVWIHDYHLMLLPGLLRARVPGASIGFFLHIPFPSFEVYRLIPGVWRSQILEGLLGSDLIGFHTYEYTQHFLHSVLRILGNDHHMGQIVTPERVVKVDTFPLGIEFDRFTECLTEEKVRLERENVRKGLPDVCLILSVDRLDYTKGILHRLQGFEILLERNPDLLGKVVLVMVVVPSRIGVDQYALMKRQIEELVGSINGRFGHVGWTPVLYQYKQLGFEALVGLYSASDVCLVTPLRDGMNLVAKEYVASREDESGVLILSEMAGAAKELGEAIVINPNNRAEIADAMAEALRIPVEEQRRRMKTMRDRLRRYTATRWAEDFVAGLGEMREVQDGFRSKLLDTRGRETLFDSFRKSGRRLLMLDYDGTLVPFFRRPELARPDQGTIDLLTSLAVDPRTTLVVISGRDRPTLDSWLGHLPIGLAAEHALWVRHPGTEWRLTHPINSEWKKKLFPILQHYADRVPGSLVEEKEHSLAWHFRNADPDQARFVASELTDNLVAFTANIDVHVLRGNKVVEVRNAGVNKGNAVAEWTGKGEYDFILAVGDDMTDEDLFAALPPHAVSVRVGLTRTRASFNVRYQREVTELLEKMAALRNVPDKIPHDNR